MSKVLVVDDSITVRNEVSQYLETNGIQVTTAEDGLKGLDAVARDPNIKLILCDVNMPQLDGLSMVERLRAAGKQVPVIMLTTENSPEMKQRGKDAGVRAWIVKPFNGSAAINGIKRLMTA